MLKTAVPPEKLTLGEFDDDEGGNGIDGIGEVKIAKKSGKSKGQNTFKSQKLTKSGKSKGKKSKEPSKSENSPNFYGNDSGPIFLTPEARSAFNCLRLAFTKAPILRHFDLEYYIQIKNDVLSYVISDVLSQLASKTSFDI